MKKPIFWGSLVFALSLSAQAQTTTPYPDRPVKLVVGFAAGGPSDLVARAFADHAAKALKQPFIVENKAGANALLATEAVAASRPDGLTLLAAATNHTMLPALYADRMKSDAAKSFKPVCTLAASATVLVVGPSLPIKTLAEFMDKAKSSSQGLTFASPGQGSSPHLATESFKSLTGTNLLHIPYRGAAPAVTDLMGGQVDVYFATVGSVLPHIQAGKLTPLAVASRQRSRLLPQVPTFEEAGLKGFVVDTWYGLLAPAGIDNAAYRALEREAQAFAGTQENRERLEAAGLEAHTVCGDAFAKQISAEIVKNAKLAQQLNLKAE